MTKDYRKYLDPQILARVSGLELRARFIVEGFFSGTHHSPHRGASVEFADHRAYTQGDDLRHIDWKVYGKTDKYYIKEYEQETNIDVMLMVDASESMAYRSAGSSLSKYDYATAAAAAVGYLALQQQDAVGLSLFDEQLTQFFRPSNATYQWKTLARALSGQTGTAKTSVGRVLQELCERLTHRVLVILISDLFDDLEAILEGLRFLRYRKHELIVWNIWDRAELTFPYKGSTLFAGLESSGKLLTDAGALQARYLEEVDRFRTKLQTGCGQMQIDLDTFDTSTPLDVALSGYLTNRAARLRRRSSRISGGG